MDPWKVEGVTMTSEELVERSSSWTLGCDNAVLNKLKILSEEVHKNSLAIKQDCDSLTEDVTRVQSRLSNITNKFLMISNTQFVENRVEEFEEANVAAEVRSNQVPKKVKTKQEKEAELLKKMKEAIQIGINSCSSSSSTIRERRQMPHLIGSSKFFSSPYVGLCDPVTVPKSVIGDNSSLEDSLGSKVSQQSFPVVPSSVSQEQTRVLPDFSSTTVNQPSTSNFQSPVPCNENNYAQKTNAYEEPSVIKQPSTTVTQGTLPTTVSRSKMPIQVSSGMGPPPLDMSDESDDDFKPQSSDTGHGRLFVDDEEDEDLFNDRSLFPPKPKADINNLFFGNNCAEVKPPVPVISPPPYNQKGDDDDLSNQVKDESKPAADNRKLDVGVLPGGRSPNPIITNRTVQEAQEQSKTDKISSSSAVKETDEPHIKIPPGAVSVFGKLPPGEFPSLKNNKERANRNQQATNTPRPLIQAETNTTRSSPNNNRSKCNTAPSQLPVNTGDQKNSTSQSSSLTPKLTNHSSQGSLSTEPSKSVLFDSDSDEDLFFSTKKKSTTQTNKSSSLFTKPLFPEQTKSNIATTAKSTAAQKQKSSLFDDSDSGDDLFSSASSSSSKNKQTAVLENKESNEETTRDTIKELPVKSLGLFGDDSDSDSDLFASLNRKSKSSVSTNIFKNTEKTLPNKSNIRIMATEESLDIQNSSSSLEHNDHLDMEHEGEACPNTNSLLADERGEESKCDKDDMADNTPDDLESFASASEESEHSVPPDIISEPVSTSVNSQESEVIVSQKREKTSKLKSKFESSFVKQSSSESAEDMEAVSQKVRPKKPTSTSELIAAIKSKVSCEESEQSQASKDVTNLEKPAKRTISVKALALGLNINPLKMKPGAKPPKINSPESSESQKSLSEDTASSLPDNEVSDNNNQLKPCEVHKEDTKLEDQLASKSIPDGEIQEKDQFKEESALREKGSMNPVTLSSLISDEIDSVAPLLVNLVKGRPKGQPKRRPPSKQLLKLYANQEEQESIDTLDSSPVTPSSDAPNVISDGNPTSSISGDSQALLGENSDNVVCETSPVDIVEKSVSSSIESELEKTFLQSQHPVPEEDKPQLDGIQNEPTIPARKVDSDGDQNLLSNDKTILNEEDDDDDIFNDKSLISAPGKNEVTPEPLSSSTKAKQIETVSSVIKEEGCCEDQKTKAKSSKKSSLFDDSDSGDDLFGSGKKTKTSLKSSKKVSSDKSSQKTKSLFDDDSDDDSDLFKPSKSKSKLKPTENNPAASKTGEIVDYGSF